ncbi:MAG: hypothetical protein D6784_14995 [Chloroflexi bacterium]|nr:MAG: hypothetical protein D6784_14995 [Chloroflexota bacterium]
MNDITLKIDSRGFVYADGVKICRLDPQRQALCFYDKDRRRAERRGSREVNVPIQALARLAEVTGTGSPPDCG